MMNDKWFGYAGKILRINLSNEKIEKEPLDKEVAKKYLGGVGYAAKILWDELEPGIDPLSPENKLIMTTGPLTGTLCPGSGSWEACFKSPMTNGWAEARAGGMWGPELKYAGFDMIILEGKAKKPVYIWIHDGDAEIKPASYLEGRSIPETETYLKEEVEDEEAKVASIGPAGENLVRFACIINDLDRAAGRCGGGAVMGSKKVKAVIVRGYEEIAPADPDAFKEATDEAIDVCLNHSWLKGDIYESKLRNGTISWLPPSDEVGDFPTKYGQSNSWGKSDPIFRSYITKYAVAQRACYSCPLGCCRTCEVKGGKYASPPHGGLEYETGGIFSGFLLNEDPEAIIHANYLCNILGLDTISTGNVLGLAMECFEKGWITEKEADGMDLSWGNMDQAIELIKKIVYRDGFGDVMAEGTELMAAKIGKGAPEVALHVKGLDVPMHDPRGGKSMAIQYGTSNRGCCHIHPHEVHNWSKDEYSFGMVPYGMPDPPPGIYEETGVGNGLIVKLIQDMGMTQDILGVCRFPTWTGLELPHYARMLDALIEWKIDDKQLLLVGERVLNLQRYFNIREGKRRKDDMIPKRLKQVPSTGVYSHLTEIELKDYEGMLDEYYQARGWNKDGIPTKEKAKELGLEECAKQIK